MRSAVARVIDSRPDAGRFRGLAWLGYVLFFSMLFVPVAYQFPKGILLAVVVSLVATGSLWHGRLALHPVVLLWTLFMVSVGLFFMMHGAANGAPGALRVGTVYVLWPLVYTALVAGAANGRIIDGLSRVLVIATIAIGLYGVSYILYAVGWLPDAFYIPIDQGQAISLYDGYMEFNLYSLASLLFLVPFLGAALLTWPNDGTMPVSRFWLWVGLLLGIALVLLSGRRALLAVAALSPFLALLFRAFAPRRILRSNRRLIGRFIVGGALITIGLGGYLQSIYGFRWEIIASRFMEGFDFVSDLSASARREQFFALLKGWAESPLLGAGHGASAVGSLRSEKILWAYELSYVALLFHTGVLGFVAYASGVIWIYWMGLRMIRSGDRIGLYMLPVLVGMSCFLIANSTNPYLGKFDYIWVIFLPIALINFWLLTRPKARVSTRRPTLHVSDGGM